MKSYYCMVNTVAVPARDIVVLGARDDETARREVERIAESWPGFETIDLFEGERPVQVLVNPAHGFPARPLAA